LVKLSSDLISMLILAGLVVVGVFLFRTILVATLQTEYPLHTPISISMQPTLNVGDLLIVQKVSDFESVHADLQNGDILVFRKPDDPNEFIVHRAIEKTWNPEDGKYYFKTKGDNNRSPDQPYSFSLVSEDDVIGKVIWKIPLLGYLKIFLGTQIGMAIAVVLFLILVFLEGWE